MGWWLFWRWWGHLNTTHCNQTYLSFLHSQVVGPRLPLYPSHSLHLSHPLQDKTLVQDMDTSSADMGVRGAKGARHGCKRYEGREKCKGARRASYLVKISLPGLLALSPLLSPLLPIVLLWMLAISCTYYFNQTLIAITRPQLHFIKLCFRFERVLTRHAPVMCRVEI